MKKIFSLLLLTGLILNPAFADQSTIDGSSDVNVRKNSVLFQKRATVPHVPGPNQIKAFASDDTGTTKIYTIDHIGTVTKLGSGSGGGSGITGGSTSVSNCTDRTILFNNSSVVGCHDGLKYQQSSGLSNYGYIDINGGIMTLGYSGGFLGTSYFLGVNTGGVSDFLISSDLSLTLKGDPSGLYGVAIYVGSTPMVTYKNDGLANVPDYYIDNFKNTRLNGHKIYIGEAGSSTYFGDNGNGSQGFFGDESLGDLLIATIGDDGDGVAYFYGGATLKYSQANLVWTLTAGLNSDVDITFTDDAVGPVLESPNGTKYRIKVSDLGVLTTEAV